MKRETSGFPFFFISGLRCVLPVLIVYLILYATSTQNSQLAAR